MRSPRYHKDFSKKSVELTREEVSAIKALEKVAAKWPGTLALFSWSGKLLVRKPTSGMTFSETIVGTINGIDNAGGDPNGADRYDD